MKSTFSAVGMNLRSMSISYDIKDRSRRESTVYRIPEKVREATVGDGSLKKEKRPTIMCQEIRAE